MSAAADQPFQDVAGRPKGPLDADAWNARYETGETPWDMGMFAPPLRSAVDEALITPPDRVLVPGCGAGHDARGLAAAGFDVVAIDIAPHAVGVARELAAVQGVKLEVREHDLLAAPVDGAPFDVVVEHTCFCAIDPSRRDDYVDAVADALTDNGALLGLFFVFEAEEGPPFGASEQELRQRFGRRFEIEVLRNVMSAPDRRVGMERLLFMRKHR